MWSLQKESTVIKATILCLLIETISTLSCTSSQVASNVIYDCHRQVLNSIPDYVPTYATHLNMSNNRLTSITYENMLDRFFNLQVFDVSGNYLSHDSFKPDVFSKSKTLKELNLQNNRITRIVSPFLKNTEITKLRLDRNKLKHLPADFLVNLPKLEELTLSGCELQTISGQAFDSVGSTFKRLDLSDNRLESLSIAVKPVIFTPSLLSIKLYYNLWSCDCHLRWLRKELESTQASWYFQGYSIIPSCEEPYDLKHKNWFIAKADKYGCPPELLPADSEITVQPGTNLSIQCSAITYMQPSHVQWMQNNVTTEYLSRLSSSRVYNGTVLTTTLIVTQVGDRDYGQYNCTIQTEFGSVTQLMTVNKPQLVSASIQSSGVIIAIVIVVVIVIIALILGVVFCLKKHLIYRGKLYMDGMSEVSRKSETDVSMQACDDSTVMTPLNLTVNTECDQPDIIKCFHGDEIDSLPVETEYPADDAGCAEYNKYLEAVSSSTSSPNFSEQYNNDSTYSQPTRSANDSPSTFIRVVSPANRISPYENGIYNPAVNMPAQPNYSQRIASPANQQEGYIKRISPPTNQQEGYVKRVSSPASQKDGYLKRVASPANQNDNRSQRGESPIASLVPYVDTPTTVQSPHGDIVNRLNTTPSGSPLTFIKEEPDENAGDLL